MTRPSVVHLQKALPRKATPRGARRPPGSLTAFVTERLREAIVDGRFALGEPLSELSLAAALNVSRTPVRDALTALQLQGLIEVRPQSGSFVFMPTEDDVAELAEFRRVLETTALRFAAARRPDDLLYRLRTAADAMQRARDADDRLGVARADTTFHQAIVEHGGNEYLLASYRLVSGRVAALRTHNLMLAGRLRDQPLAEHRALIDALAHGNVRRAEALLGAHIRRMRLRFDAVRSRAIRGGHRP